MTNDDHTTWDGLPISETPPYGAAVIVVRRVDSRDEVLILHRARSQGTGNWAWTPPSGARFPDEDVHVCARRELKEETGIETAIEPTEYGSDEWAVFITRAAADAEVRLDAEHDEFRWVDLDTAIAMCSPEQVAQPLKLYKDELTGLDFKNWQPLSVQEVAEIFADLPVRWWIAGGWAIDLFVGHQTREHGDTDVVILRDDQLIVQKHLAGWDIYKAALLSLKPWQPGEFLGQGIHDIWCRKNAESPWKLQLMLVDTRDDTWLFRRSNLVGGSIAEMGRCTENGVPYIAPEVQLLYKAKSLTIEKNQADFETTVPLLDASAREWLRRRLEDQYPQGHEWTAALSSVAPNTAANTPAPWDADRELNATLVQAVVEEQFAELRPVRVEFLGSGWDNDCYLINGEWVFRFPRRRNALELIARERAVMPVIAETLAALPVQVPVFEKAGQPGVHFPYPFTGHRMVPGVEEVEIAETHGTTDELATRLGELFSVLHALPPERVAHIDIPTCTARPSYWRQSVMDAAPRIREVLPDPLREICEPYLSGTVDVPPRYTGPPRFIHNDIGDHILVTEDSGRLTGIIDFEDVAFGDPVADFIGLQCRLGTAFVDRMLSAYTLPLDADVCDRLTFMGHLKSLDWLGDVLWQGDTEHVPKHVRWIARAFESE